MTSDYKLFASDMDGTFLRNDHTYDRDRFARVLEKFDQKGKVFCAASGRQLLALESLFAGFEDRMAFVAENGCLVSYKGDILAEESLNSADLSDLIDFLSNMIAGPGQDYLISGLKGSYVPAGASENFFKKSKLFYQNVQKIGHLSDIKDVTIKLTTNFSSEAVHECEELINKSFPRLRATTTGFTAVDIIPQGISKATGLAVLADDLGLSAGQVVVFGDQRNDLEMFAYAGYPVAVENAKAELKELAREIIANNNRDAVLEKLEEM